MQTFRVETGGPLLATLTALTGNRTEVKQWLRLRRITVNGATAERHDQPVAAGDVIEVGAAKRILPEARVPGLTIVHEDDSVILIDKPAGLLTIATERVQTRTAYHMLNEHLKRRFPDETERIFIVHRLDRETSGLMLFARSHDIKQTLQDDWENVEKRYYAVVEGTPDPPTGTIESFLAENRALNVFSSPRKTALGKHAVTHYKVLKTNGKRSLLEVRTLTGRKHQIRVHLADLGHPIAGDDRYGPDAKNKFHPPEKLSKKRLAALAENAPPEAKRLGLHASYLRFRHPETGEYVEFRSEMPGPMAKLMR